MKYWSCCQRKTSEFQHFLDQEGCEIGKHKWVDDKGKQKQSKLFFTYFKAHAYSSCFPGKDMKCRYDWHQTATHITVAVYAKKYDFNVSYVEVSPVR